MQNVQVCLWYDDQAEEASKLYTKLFKSSGEKRVATYGKSGAKMSGKEEGSVMTVEFDIEGLQIMGLNGGPHFKFTPAFSFSVFCESEKELDEKWAELSKGGKVLMPLQEYPWSKKYGWTEDRFGVGWQLTWAKSPHGHKVSPTFLFVEELFGKGDEALKFYTSVIPNSRIHELVRDDKTGTVMYSAFTLNGQGFNLMEGAGEHGHKFNNAASIVLNCDSQEEIDEYWNKLSAGGSIEECGWLKDKFGVSWQIVPAAIADVMTDPAKSEKVMAAMYGMKKLDMNKLMQAARS